jgi:hypothetical protein
MLTHLPLTEPWVPTAHPWKTPQCSGRGLRDPYNQETCQPWPPGASGGHPCECLLSKAAFHVYFQQLSCYLNCPGEGELGGLRGNLTFFGGWNWGLNLKLYTSKACVLTLDPYLQSIFALVILEMGLLKLFAQLALNHNPPNLSLPSC